MTFRVSKVRTEVDKKAIEKFGASRELLRELFPTGDEISERVKSATSGSSTVSPFGRKMSVEEVDGKVRVGTSWGPAVPVEYGTIRTPAKRILLGAAEKIGRVEFR